MPDPHPHRLHPHDQAAIDALVDAGFDAEQVEPSLRSRADQVNNLLGLLEHLPVEEPGDLLVARTLQRIGEARQKQNAERDAAAFAAPIGPGFRWNDLIAVAAMVLVTVSIAMPMLSHNRANARKIACEANLASAGLGFDRYAGDFGGQLPVVKSQPGDTWWNVNTFDKDNNAQSNSAHAFVLISGGYVDPKALTCAANEHAPVKITIKMRDWPDANAVSFSYQNQFTANRPTWNNASTIAVLADKNPMFIAGKQVEDGDKPLTSPNHARLGGQNALLSDGSVQFIRIPVLGNGDNIYHVRDGKARYTGREAPADATDSFLVP